MSAPRMVRMPHLDSGMPCPNPIRWTCDQGHIHPSRSAAVKCNSRLRRRVRPDSCPRCGRSCKSHTGSYCQHCGEDLLQLEED